MAGVAHAMEMEKMRDQMPTRSVTGAVKRPAAYGKQSAERGGSPAESSKEANEGKWRASESFREEVRKLPDLMEEIHDMGLTVEYAAYRDRFLAWRQGGAKGATGELQRAELERKTVGKYGFGYWYPTLDVWKYRRTTSYWIAVTFFEGSLFFSVSSFMYCYEEELGDLARPLTVYGYIAGKVNFIICTYLMCVETINLTADHKKDRKETVDLGSLVEDSSEDDDSEMSDSAMSSDSSAGAKRSFGTPNKTRRKEDRFYFNPFRYKKALSNLDKLGAGPWPYFASLIYFLGVGFFTIGLAAEFMTFLPKSFTSPALSISFLIGSLFFFAGGIFECIENKVGRGGALDTGWWGAVLNTAGSLGFVVGATMGFWKGPAITYWADFSYGIGSVIFAFGSGLMIVMWKDEQFGLTFLAVLNGLGGPSGKPLIPGNEQVEEEETYSPTETVFIMVYCLAAALSVYCFTIDIREFTFSDALKGVETFNAAFNAFLPCIFSHMLLVVRSAVMKTPKTSPFRELLIGSRWFAAIMVLNSLSRIVDAIVFQVQNKRSNEIIAD